MTNALLTPLDFSSPVKAGRRKFWKKILHKGSINYKGQKVDFDDQFHTDLAEAYREGAYDQVPLVFADGENRHNEDPRNFGGDVLDIQHRTDGTYALIETDRDTAKAIEKNPKLGVSARIVQGLSKSDGREFPRAVRHVLLTMNPRVSGLGPWQAVDLSEEDAEIEVVDLTAESYEKGTQMATKTKAKATGERTMPEIDLSALSDEEFQDLLDFTATLTEDDVETEDDPEGIDPDETEDLEAETTKRKKKSKTKITVEKESEDDGPEDGDEDDDDDEDEAETDLSEVVAHQGETRNRVRTMELNLAAERWNNERSSLLKAGVPPFLLDLAEPVLSLPEAMTLDLSDDESVDASDILRKMLNGVKGVMDFTPEIGSAIELSDALDKKDPDQAILDRWDTQYG